MRVFVTGATGFIGSSVVRELLAGGHDVLGLARSEHSARALETVGAEAHSGSLEDLDSLREGASRADAVIHLGFNHDFSRFAESCAHDARIVEALGSALEGSDRLLVVTSGTAMLPPGQVSTEATPMPSGPNAHPRVATERACDAVAERGVKVAVIRLAPSVHAEGDKGFVSFVADFARKNGASAYIGDGTNRWCAVNRDDAARLYRLALERNAGDVRYHGVAEEGVVFRDIAVALGHDLDLPVVSKPADEAEAHFDWFAFQAVSDAPASSARTRETLGWSPTGAGLIEDIGRGIYSAARTRRPSEQNRRVAQGG